MDAADLSHMHLQWFAEGDDQTGSAEGTAAGADEEPEGGKGKKATARTSAADLTPEAFAELESKYNHMLKVFKEKETRERKQTEDAAKKRGEYEKLHEQASAELEQLKPRLERMSGVIQTMLDAELAALPKGFDRTLLPEGDPDVQLAWLAKAKKAGIIKAPEAAGSDGAGKRGGDGTPPAAKNAQPSGLQSLYKS